MLFNYKAITKQGEGREGSIEAVNMDVAITALQKRGLIVSSVRPEKTYSWIYQYIPFINSVSNKDIVIFTRQMATLFSSHISALRVFQLISTETENPLLRKALFQVTTDIQEGSSISDALSRHPNIFSEFYVNMVKAGEETGKLGYTFTYLADYLDRTYEITTKVRNAMIYPIFVVTVFIGVMVLMLTFIIPRISPILLESGQELPIYTKIVIWFSDFLLNYGLWVLVAIILAGLAAFRHSKMERGKLFYSDLKLKFPLLGGLFRKLYLARISDNMNTMLFSGISMVKAIESTSEVVGNNIYKNILEESLEKVKGGSSFSQSLADREHVPSIFVQMVKVGEESGEMGEILKTMSKFYQREVENAVDKIIDLIEPAMIVLLGLGVGILLAAVLMPIYNIAGAF